MKVRHHRVQVVDMKVGKDRILELYSLFYLRIVKGTLNKISDRDEKVIDNFIIYLEKEYKQIVNEEFIFWYIAFQFEYRYKQETRFGTNVMMISWCFGKQALNRFKNRKGNWEYFLKEFITNNNIPLVSRESILFHKMNYISVSDVEEREKVRFKNDPDSQLLHCQDYTTLYHPESRYCQDCRNKEECKELLKCSLRLIYDKRCNIE